MYIPVIVEVTVVNGLEGVGVVLAVVEAVVVVIAVVGEGVCTVEGGFKEAGGGFCFFHLLSLSVCLSTIRFNRSTCLRHSSMCCIPGNRFVDT